MNSTTTRPNSIIFDLIALTKPRVNFLIIFTAIVGMLLAQDYDLNYSLMIYASIGIYLAASAAAVINQIVDQKIDAIMDRTKSRPLIKGNVTSGHAIFFSIIISTISTYILYEYVNTITTILTLFSIIVYSIIYSKSFVLLVTVRPLIISNLVPLFNRFNPPSGPIISFN